MPTPNARLKSVIADLGWSQQQVAARFVRVAREMGYQDLLGVKRSTISMWVAGHKPRGQAPNILCEALSRGSGRRVSPADIGLDRVRDPSDVEVWWRADALAALEDPGEDVHRRKFINAAVYSATGLILSESAWWSDSLEHAAARVPRRSGRVTKDDVDAIREATTLFQRMDQKRGGGYGTSAASVFLNDEVLPTLRRRTPSEQLRRDLFSAASELVYVLGWSAFDGNRHGRAQRYLQLSIKLAAEAGDRALAGHELRALAHQAMDLGHDRQAAELTAISMEQAFVSASPRERALLGVVRARSLARIGDRHASAKALLRAEDDLANATDGDDEPGRVWFFGEASLAHETARTLQCADDFQGAQRQFERSVRLRGTAFTRTHAVTLGYLGELQAARGEIEAACATWAEALDTMDGIRSGRALNTVRTMRSELSRFRGRGVSRVGEVDHRAAEILREVA